MPRRGTVSLRVRVDRTHPDPLRLQLVRQLRDQIRGGALRAGTRLPGSRLLACQLGVSRGVIVAAYDELVAQGLVTVAPRRTPIVRPVASRPALPRPQPPPVIDFAIDRPDLSLFPRRAWSRAYTHQLTAAADRELDYRDARGDANLRRALSDYLARRRGVVADPASIIICQGATQAIMLTLVALAQNGARRVVVEDPSAAPIRAAASLAGLLAQPVAVDADGLVVSGVHAAQPDVVIVSPCCQFPSTTTLSDDRRDQLVILARAGVVVIENDHPGGLAPAASTRAALHACAADRVIHIGSFSRLLAPAVRVGWIVAPDPFAALIVAAKTQLDAGSPILEQRTLARLMHSGAFDRHVQHLRDEYATRRGALAAMLAERLGDVLSVTGHGSLHLVATLRSPASCMRLAAAASARRVRILPLGDYQQAPPAVVSALTLGIGRVPAATAPAAVGLLSSVLEDTRQVGGARARW
jgi:GntR family transcriptional regulator / MocR family aminotransferase